MRKGIVCAFAALTLLAGCKSQSSETANVPAKPKWQGPAYHLALGAMPAKPNPAGLTLPEIKYTANPEALEGRVDLVVQFDNSGAKTAGPQVNQMIMAPVDIKGTDGALPADYMSDASKDLAQMLSTYCLKGKIKISVALASSSLMVPATNEQVEEKRISDWVPTVIEFKNRHPKC
ncbi:MAG: hypothetical protein ACLGP3_00435 [Acidobacteriota bacterium]